MPIEASIAQHCPFMAEGDVLSLSPDFALGATGVLRDTLAGAQLQIVPAGQWVIRKLSAGIAAGELRRAAAKRQIADIQLAELLGFLNLTGGLVRTRANSDWLRAGAQQLSHFVLGIRYSPLSWRRRATLAYISMGVCRASAPVLIAALLVGLLAVGSGLVPSSAGTHALAFGLTTFLLSLLLHESMHVLVVKNHHMQAAVLQRGMRLGILHRKLPPKAEITSALLGPAVGLVTGAAGGLCVWPYSPLLALLGLAIGLFHLAGLLPWYGDGVSLHRGLTSKGAHI